jgi:very-short-patch-repair endonuclease
VTLDLRPLLGPFGVARVSDLAGRVDRHTITRHVAEGRLLRAHRGVVAAPACWDDWRTRALAGVLATGGVLSHATALAVWRVLEDDGGPVHLSVPAGRRALRSRGLVVHRVRDLDPDRLGPYPVTPLARSLVDAWGWACGAHGSRRAVDRARGAVIETLRDRRVTATRLQAEAVRRPALPGRSGLTELVRLVEQGCQSELEIWGARHVLSGPGMPRFVQQHPVVLPDGRRVLLDAAVPHLKVAVELDGAAFHGSAEARERDIRRDVALAALGWVVLRFSHRRLTTDPDACRREILQVCRAREALLGSR